MSNFPQNAGMPAKTDQQKAPRLGWRVRFLGRWRPWPPGWRAVAVVAINKRRLEDIPSAKHWGIRKESA